MHQWNGKQIHKNLFRDQKQSERNPESQAGSFTKSFWCDLQFMLLYCKRQSAVSDFVGNMIEASTNKAEWPNVCFLRICVN